VRAPHPKQKGISYDPAQDGFVFSKAEIEEFTQRRMRVEHTRGVEQFLYIEGASALRKPNVK
jgi:hypothetical protein